MATDKVLRVRMTGTTEQVRAYLSQHPMEAGRVHLEAGHATIDAFVREGLLDVLRSRGLRIELLFDADKRGRAAMRDVAKGNRFDGGRIPQGLGLRRRV